MSEQKPVRRRRIAGERRQPEADHPVRTRESAAPTERPAKSPRPAKPKSAKSLRSGGIPLLPLLPLLPLVLLGLLTAAAVGVAAYFWFQADEAEAVDQARDRAPAVAERAAEAILSYNHESLEADKQKAARFMTDGYRSEYVDTFDSLVAENAEKLEAEVAANVRASSVMPPGEDTGAGHQRVLLFVNQTTTSTAHSGEPQTALNRVRLDMVEVDGTWLVNGITSY